MTERITVTEGGYDLTVWKDGGRRPWVDGGHQKDGKLIPTYRMVPWWRLRVTDIETGEYREGWALVTNKEDALGVASGMVRAWLGGFPEQMWPPAPRTTEHPRQGRM